MTEKEYGTILNAGVPAGSDSLPLYIIKETTAGIYQIPYSSISFENGEIWLTGKFDDEMAQRFISILHIAGRMKKRLRIYLNSPGGSVSAGLAMISAKNSYPYPIDIICVGLAASMGAVFLASGEKGHRFIQPYAKMMLHEPLIAGSLGGSASSIQRTAESIMETKHLLNDLLSKYTGRTVEEIDKNTAFDNFFNAEEAVEFGLCDTVKEDLDYPGDD